MWDKLLITFTSAGNVPERMEWIGPGADHTMCRIDPCRPVLRNTQGGNFWLPFSCIKLR